jgi:hypothetical protein
MEHRVDEAAQFARGLHEALLPAVSECDQSMRGVAISQRVLNTQLDKLSEGTCSTCDCCLPPSWRLIFSRPRAIPPNTELAKFSEHLPLPSLMPHAAKLQRTKQTIAGVNVIMARVHARLENVRCHFVVSLLSACAAFSRHLLVGFMARRFEIWCARAWMAPRPCWCGPQSPLPRRHGLPTRLRLRRPVILRALPTRQMRPAFLMQTLRPPRPQVVRAAILSPLRLQHWSTHLRCRRPQPPQCRTSHRLPSCSAGRHDANIKI